MYKKIDIDINDFKKHNFVIGISGKGSTDLFKDLGNKEFEKYRIAKEKEFLNKNIEKDIIAKEKRLNRLKLNYWENFKTENEIISEFSNYYDYLSMILEIENPTLLQVKFLFMQTPANIFGSGISWGFGDTEVRENMYEYVKENIETLKKEIENII